MACVPCGMKREARLAGNYLSEPWVDGDFNDRAMLLLSGDDYDCAPYHGRWTGTHVHVAGQGTEHEQMFLKSNRKIGVAYAREHGVDITRLVNVTRLCHDTVLAFLGE